MAASLTARTTRETNFAWAVYAGMSYKVNPSLTIDLSYRYADLGDIRTGNDRHV